MVTDLKYLQQMTGNNSEMMREMIELFLAQLMETQSKLDASFKDDNWLDLSRLSHKMKSSALVMGIQLMANEMIALEGLAKGSKDAEKCKASIDNFNNLVDDVEMELLNYLASLE
jgi:HPt (histidine-containing phosphotransfer) domain-containing protein